MVTKVIMANIDGNDFIGQSNQNNKKIILCSIDSGNIDVHPTPLYESSHRNLWSLQITITLTESALLIFFLIRG